MPLFIYTFGSSLDVLGEPAEAGAEERDFVEQVAGLCIRFGIIGLLSGVTGLAMVTLWSISGERQVYVALLNG